ncbi:MAG: von Willebrand factor type A domain-containing protein, partial [Pseudomonadota bacterium]
ATALLLTGCATEVANSPRAAAVATPESYGAAGITVDGDRFPDAVANGEIRTTVDRTSTISLDVDTASYSYARRIILGEGRLPPPQSIRPEEWINYFDYPSYPSPAPGAALQTASWVYQAPWQLDRAVIHIGAAAADPRFVARTPQNLVVLADVSGSMRGRDSVGLAGDVVRSLARLVSPEDQVAVVAFSGSAQTILPPTSGASPWAIEQAADTLQAGGWTAGTRGLDHAYDLARRSARPGDTSRVIMVTDGVFNDGARTSEQLVDYVSDRRRSGVNLSVLGVSRGGLDDSALQALAQAGNGEAAYLDDSIEAERVLSRLVEAGAPVARDARLDVEFNPAFVRSWRLVGYETREISRAEFFDPRTDAAEIRPGQTTTFIYEVALQPTSYESPEPGPYRYPGAAGTGADGTGFVQPYRNGTANLSAGVNELAFVRLRYRDAATGRMVEQRRPVTGYPRAQLAQMPTDIRFAAAVAMAAQAARSDTGRPRQMAELAESYAIGALGNYPSGDRAEFLRIADRITWLVPQR